MREELLLNQYPAFLFHHFLGKFPFHLLDLATAQILNLHIIVPAGLLLYRNGLPLFIRRSCLPSFLTGVVGRRGAPEAHVGGVSMRSEEHTSELQSRGHLVC